MDNEEKIFNLGDAYIVVMQSIHQIFVPNNKAILHSRVTFQQMPSRW